MEECADMIHEGFLALIPQLRERVAVVEAETAWLREALEKEREQSGCPAWVQANRKLKDKKPWKKGAPGSARRREVPTEGRVHALAACPGWGRKLSGGWVHRWRQGIELPAEPVRIIEHGVLARQWGGVRSGGCRSWTYRAKGWAGIGWGYGG